jgi:hypothetical protein
MSITSRLEQIREGNTSRGIRSMLRVCAEHRTFYGFLYLLVIRSTEGALPTGSAAGYLLFGGLLVSFLQRGLPTLQRCLKLSLPQRLAKVVIHPCRKTLFAFSLQGVSRQGDDVDRRLPRAR